VQVLIFRAELLCFLGPLMLAELLRNRISFFEMIWWGVAAGVLSVALTVGFDSLIWGRVLWSVVALADPRERLTIERLGCPFGSA
jgi:hypothetical protein